MKFQKKQRAERPNKAETSPKIQNNRTQKNDHKGPYPDKAINKMVHTHSVIVREKDREWRTNPKKSAFSTNHSKLRAGGFWLGVATYLVDPCGFCPGKNFKRNEKNWGEHRYPRIPVCLQVFPIEEPDKELNLK